MRPGPEGPGKSPTIHIPDDQCEVKPNFERFRFFRGMGSRFVALAAVPRRGNPVRDRVVGSFERFPTLPRCFAARLGPAR